MLVGLSRLAEWVILDRFSENQLRIFFGSVIADQFFFSVFIVLVVGFGSFIVTYTAGNVIAI